MKNILIIGAHYDDAELGCGGTAAKLVHEGKSVYKMTLTDTEVFSSDMGLNIRKENAWNDSQKACDSLGMEQIPIETAKYGCLAYSQDMMQHIEHFILKKEIDTVFMHYMEDYNTDHIAAHQISKTAARHCRNIFMYQSNPYILVNAFNPNFFVDITDYVEDKKQALAHYEKDHNRQGSLFETNIERNQVWGYGNHVMYAEGFEVVKYCIE